VLRDGSSLAIIAIPENAAEPVTAGTGTSVVTVAVHVALAGQRGSGQEGSNGHGNDGGKLHLDTGIKDVEELLEV
jgi:hypothetical protein